ncbi:hypothetical protein JK359_18490 [Streptomyces actinomycinicus]|uniref:Uncharacterized protein n=1 Tax=Streptomyces actinomycinicus TaxID=1695166 RepID=A0A937EK34_9ACTN|nr:hypothetical protein [Streptomyces actinomycinicus]MBL1083933.1 hypothetical protein [Streptomyces actinomycinicus]
MLLPGLPRPPRALHRIADAFLHELRAYGRLTSPGDGLGAASCSAYVEQRATVAHGLFTVLEGTAGLRFAREERIPFVYCRSGWPADAPPAGYTGDSPAVRPGVLTASLAEAWLNRAAGNGLARVVKGALWQLRHAGLHGALAFVLDLHGSGFVTGGDLGRALHLLVRGRSQVSSDEEAVTAFLGERDADAASWPGLALQTGWIGPDTPPVDADVIDALLARGVTEIDRVRGAADFDDWHIGHVQLYDLLSTIKGLAEAWCGPGRLPLAWRAKLKQWEEMTCDSMGVIGLACDHTAPIPSWDGTEASYMNTIREQYEACAGPHWRSRFCRERLLVPDRLRPLVLGPAGAADIPGEWRGLSRRTIRPWMAAFRGAVRPDRWRAVPCPPARLADHPDVRAAFGRLGVVDRAEQLRLIRTHLFNGLTGEDAPAHTPGPGGEEEEAAFSVFRIDLLALLPPTSERVRTGEVLLDGLLRAQHDFVDEEWRGRPEPESFLRMYPYAVPVLHLAVAERLDRGETERALDGLVDHLVLEPTLGVAWQAMSALLGRLGHEQEARAAGMCALVLT